MLLNLDKRSGCSFEFQDAKNPDRTGDIPDGAFIHIICRGSADLLSLRGYIIVEVDGSHGFVKMARPGRQNYSFNKSLEFVYQAKEIVELEV